MSTLELREEKPNSSDALDERGRENSVVRERLDSWKEIAAYMRRSVRCVQRWERSEGMPVFRHQHAKGVTVYAYRDELNEWWHQDTSDQVSLISRSRPLLTS
jgi:hypothetical protein